jgi:hypothetical protein
MSLLSRGRKARFESPLENLQHVLGNDLMVMGYEWRTVMDNGGIPDRKTTDDLLKRAYRVARALNRFKTAAEQGMI